MPSLTRRIPFAAPVRRALSSQIASDAGDGILVSLRALRASTDTFPPLKSAVSAALVLLEMSEKIKRNKAESKNLAERAARLVSDIWGQTRDLKALPGEVESCILDVETLFREIETLFHELEKEKYLRRLVRQDSYKARIGEYTRLLDLATSQFSINLQLSIHNAQLAHIAANEKRHDDLLSVSQMSEAERLQLLIGLDAKMHVGMYAAVVGAGGVFFLGERGPYYGAYSVQ
ncbi:hypothetical protein FB45DRAFT_906045 [Roridomyces roridus]|uniref:Uncharacterized protein n=1 Tax=Roridomyces roridus TaxID=1738132 RepID=A0AAD7C609_9AGAR|nr:hypothetical protein FB45DRAFT_906045 [Roridomyces roridus]